LKVVLDTNVLLVALPRRSPDHIILTALMKGSFSLCVTSDILDEYAEIFQRRANPIVSAFALDLLDVLPNLIRINKFYFWRLIHADPDDNKFVDCAIAANADFIVTDDRHFNVLKTIDFPKVRILNKKEFIALLEQLE